MRAKLAEVEEIPGGAQITTELTFEREGCGEARVRRRVADARVHRLSSRGAVCERAPLERYS